MIIGLTGAYCAGKNHVARLLEKRGFEVLDVDKLGHAAIESEKAAIVDRFGAAAMGPDGSVDRKKLGAIVFRNPVELAALEAIIHPEANRMTEEWIAARQGRDLAINAALLHRSSSFGSLDCVFLVKAPFLARLIRALRRDKLPIRDLLRRFHSQHHFEYQYFGAKADIHIVRNNGFFRPCAAFNSRRLERRIDSILARKGMVR